MYKVVVDRSHALVSVTAEGFVTEAEFTSAANELIAAIRSLGDRAGRHVTLFDFTRLTVALPAVVTAFSRYFIDPAMAPIWARRVAIIAASSLMRLQTERVAQLRQSLRVFDDRREAIAWLLADHDRLRTISQPTAASG